jgi:hypothetical protein
MEFAIAQCATRMLGYMRVSPEQAQQARQACAETLQFESVKGRSGAEYQITGQWGKDTTRVVKTGRRIQTVTPVRDNYGRTTQHVSEVEETVTQVAPWAEYVRDIGANEMIRVFFSTAKYAGPANVFLGELARTHWHGTFMKTVAFDTSARATPAEVLNTQLMRETASPADPDFDPDQAAGGVKKPSQPKPSRWLPNDAVKKPTRAGMLGSVQPLEEQPVENSNSFICPDWLHAHFRQQGVHKLLICIKQPTGVLRVINA